MTVLLIAMGFCMGFVVAMLLSLMIDGWLAVRRVWTLVREWYQRRPP